ncbi:MAG TPA: tRNA preQ1(34) S-adenosylmethionine ribosyltransferase-isomerase QueA [Geobacteraceae bacterium]|nr:tRNA preQ1(34) S-adenosylmethionine ribosyltransferase-isomerase QueA [Geobacteraceae bacterium]
MRLEDFDFDLPPELIATEPLQQRDAARLMLLDRYSGEIGESLVSSLPGLLRSGDLLVLNDTRVLPARLFGCKESGGKVELFLVRRLEGEDERWEALLRSSKPSRPGTRILLEEEVVATVLDSGEGETRVVSFSCSTDFMTWLERAGQVPLPPYIRRAPVESDRERYQTVFAAAPGAVAAPTAGLHFTAGLLEKIRNRGVQTTAVTLHVGLGTFMPMRVEDPRSHRMHSEWYSVPEDTVAAIETCRAGGGRVVAVGTTVTRTLEHAAKIGVLQAGSGETEIFIFPGHEFKVVDALITNFHLPKSTLLMLVSAFAGRESVLHAYAEAVARGFRFYSYGDAMFIS